jgi:hypothetical protein
MIYGCLAIRSMFSKSWGIMVSRWFLAGGFVLTLSQFHNTVATP